MRAVMLEVPAAFLDERRRRGADIWDEMWKGELHMPPAPNVEHQNVEGELEAWIRTYWTRRPGRRVYHGVNLAPPGGWPDDYRIPDLVLLTPECPAQNRGECLEGPPTVVVEIQSPGDETYEKLPFYAELGVSEVWIINRDSRSIEVYALRTGAQEPLPPTPDGWLHSISTGIQLRTEPGRKLAVQLVGDASSRRLLPEFEA